MAKLYIFGIGGTGSRVLRSFTMLMAAGVELGNGINEIVPIIIDPDNANADLTRAVGLIGKYRNIRKDLTFTGENRFFLPDIAGVLQIQIAGTNNLTLQQFMQLPSMDKSSEAMIRMLFSEKNLQSSMDVGFKGNPNIGSVVLNQIVGTNGFKVFANSFKQGDMIFIISSIFGGTGASGFPLLLKTLRTGQFNGNALINNAAIGAVTVLPYFKIETDNNSEIDSSTFISKTKSAMAYYEKNIVNNSSLNALYYLADEASKTYSNNVGGTKQENDAHLIEFLAATAIVDFTYDPNYPNPNGNISTSNREFGIVSTHKDGTVTFKSFGNKDKQYLYRPLTQFVLLSLCMTDKYDYFRSDKFDANIKYFKEIKTFMGKVKDFCEEYKKWLAEMKRNKRSLDLFNLDCKDEPFNVVTDVKPGKARSYLSNYDLVADRLNGKAEKNKNKKAEDMWMEMFYLGTEKLFKEKLEKSI